MAFCLVGGLRVGGGGGLAGRASLLFGVVVEGDGLEQLLLEY